MKGKGDYMTEKDLLDKIKQSAEQIDIPDTITPEHITVKLNQKTKLKKIYHFPLKTASSAAAVLLLCGILWGTAQNPVQPPVASESSEISKEEDCFVSEKKVSQTNEPKQNAGSLYTIADSYDEVYNVLKSSYNYEDKEVYYYTDSAEDIAVAENRGELAQEAKTAENTQDLSSAAKKEASSFSTTNLQTEGVDESDIVKTDGRYIYTVREQEVIITDTSENDLRYVTSIRPDMDSVDSVLELYVDQDILLLLTEHYDTALEEQTETYSTDESLSEDTSSSGFIPLEGCDKINSVSTNCSTIAYIYDITNPAEPSFKGTASQDGFYQTSRKIGDILYLFTRKGQLAVTSSYTDNQGGIIPCVNGEKIAYDHIYLPNEGNDGLVISSIRLNKPDEILDKVMIIHNYVEIYVGNDSIYLYHSEYQNEQSLTQIAKFSIKDGVINAVDASSVKGEIYDTFAINEYQNTLRVLTTSYDKNGISSNRLYTFDENLKQTGLLDNIARGEEIYAARYFGNTAYFITYRNIDPLFAVDLSDISNPKLLGELEITGFSEYLHLWENDKLLGIGYETDPDTGQRKGLKLVMFDISNPTELKILDSIVLDNCYYSPALYDYKCVLADSAKNLIGFAAEYESSSDEDAYFMNYSVYSWENGHFAEKQSEHLPQDTFADSVRGLYINNTFYINDSLKITSFDMENNFQKQKQLLFKK